MLLHQPEAWSCQKGLSKVIFGSFHGPLTSYLTLAERDSSEQASIRARMPVASHRRFFSQGARQRPVQDDEFKA